MLVVLKIAKNIITALIALAYFSTTFEVLSTFFVNRLCRRVISYFNESWVFVHLLKPGLWWYLEDSDRWKFWVEVLALSDLPSSFPASWLAVVVDVLFM